jgi:nicotinamide phosphoribosyltransferase
MINENNLILKVDSYKSSQWKQYPPKTTRLFSYMSSRGGVYPETIWCSLQLYLKKYLSKPVTEEDVEEAKKFFSEHGVDFNYDGWMYIVKELSGKLPVRIRAVPEGTRVPVNCVLMTIESTDPKCFWVVNWLESLLLKTWYPTTVATQSYYIRKTIYDALVKTAENPDAEIDFKLHSFGYRGVSSEESGLNY